MGLEGFSIADNFQRGSDVDNLTENRNGWALRLAVFGDVSRPELVEGGYQVRDDWLHLPENVSIGRQFRLLFLTSTRSTPRRETSRTTTPLSRTRRR